MDIVSDCEHIVSRPGKFEGESRWVPYFWDHIMDGDGEIIDIGDDASLTVLQVLPEDVELFPELKGMNWIYLETTSQGFVIGSAHAERNYDIERDLGGKDV